MGRRHTILYCNPFSQKISGADESLLALLAGLDRSRYRPLVAVPSSSPYEPRYRNLGVDVYHVPVFGLRRSWSHLARNALHLAPCLASLVRLVEHEHVDLVHSNMSVVLQGGLGSRLMGVPSLYHVRSTSIAKPALACDLLVRYLECSADRFIAISDSIAEILISRRVRRPVHVIHDAVDLSAFDHVPDLEVIPGRKLVVGTMGRINPRKSLETFIRAAAILSERFPGTRFVVHGGTADAEEQAYLDSLVQLRSELGLVDDLEFTGHRTDVVAAMQEMDVFLMTSIDEGFGRVVVEAMAAGRPVVGSAIGGIRELVRHGDTGWLVPPADSGALAEATGRYVVDPETLRRHSRSARESVKIMDVGDHARRIEAIYEEMIGSRAT